MATKPKTNPRDIIREIRQSFLDSDYYNFSINGYKNNEIHEWEFAKTLRANGRRVIVLKGHTVLTPFTLTVIRNDSTRGIPYEEGMPACLEMIDNNILNDTKLIVTYIQDDNLVKYDCRGEGGLPSRRCYDYVIGISAKKLTKAVKAALASPYTDLGKRRLTREYNDLATNYRIPNNSNFGKTRKFNNLVNIIKYLESL